MRVGMGLRSGRPGAWRVAAGLVAVLALYGEIGFFTGQAAKEGGDWLRALWVNAGYLTDLTNSVLFIVMAGVALNIRLLSRPALVGWAVTAIAFVGIAFQDMGGRLVWGQSGLDDWILHGVTPFLSPLFWLAFAPKGTLKWRTILIWNLWPIAYWIYALLRGWLTAAYAYSVVNVEEKGAAPVVVSAIRLFCIYVAIALFIVGIDKLAGRRVKGRAKDSAAK